jgi:hypothetical protein
MNGQISCEGPMGKTSLFDMEGLTAVDPASMFRKDDMSPKVRTAFATRSCLVYGCCELLSLCILCLSNPLS